MQLQNRLSLKVLHDEGFLRKDELKFKLSIGVSKRSLYLLALDSPPLHLNGLKNQGATCYLNSLLQVRSLPSLLPARSRSPFPFMPIGFLDGCAGAVPYGNVSEGGVSHADAAGGQGRHGSQVHRRAARTAAALLQSTAHSNRFEWMRQVDEVWIDALGGVVAIRRWTGRNEEAHKGVRLGHLGLTHTTRRPSTHCTALHCTALTALTR
jgi:hypothetical protein